MCIHKCYADNKTSLPTLIDPYSARIAIALGGVVTLLIKQQIHYPIAIISAVPIPCRLPPTFLRRH
ncbi:MAG: hypothetical protein OET45_08875 [Chromatiales bacterium]|nr:hypothetical protein [Chromatiales bacterium]